MSPLISTVLPAAVVRIPELLTDKLPSILSVPVLWTPRLPSSSRVPTWTVLVPDAIESPRLADIVNVPVESPMKLIVADARKVGIDHGAAVGRLQRREGPTVGLP